MKWHLVVLLPVLAFVLSYGVASALLTDSQTASGTVTAEGFVAPTPTPQPADYDLLAIRPTRATAFETGTVVILFKNVGAVEGPALAELWLNGEKQSDKLVTDPVGNGPYYDFLPVTYDAPGKYTIEVRLISGAGTDSVQQTARVR